MYERDDFANLALAVLLYTTCRYRAVFVSLNSQIPNSVHVFAQDLAEM